MNKIYERRFGTSKILIHKYSCESNTEKQNWIAAVDRHADATMNRIEENFKATCAGSTQDEDHEASNGNDADSRDGDEHDSSESSSSSGSSSKSAASSQANEPSEAAAADAVPDIDTGTDEPVCIFRNILDMGSAEAECAVHKKKCPIPTVDILVVGTSCKDMSRANTTAPKSAVLRMDTSKGGSAQTFQGLLRLLDERPPAIVLFENVDAIDENKEGGESNLDIFKAETSSRGYDSQVVLTDAYEFGLPCKRRRIFILLVRTNNNILLDFHSRTLSGMFTTFGALLHGCLRSATCAANLWLPADDPAVLRELQNREEKRASERARKEKDEKEGKPIVTPSAGWVDQHMNFAASLKRRWGMAPPAKLQGNRWFQILTPREQDMLPHLQAERPELLMRDISQNIYRAHHASINKDTGSIVAPTVLPRQLMWIEGNDSDDSRLLLGREALLYQGFPSLPFLQQLQEEQLSLQVQELGPQAAFRRASEPGSGPQAAIRAQSSEPGFEPQAAIRRQLSSSSLASGIGPQAANTIRRQLSSASLASETGPQAANKIRRQLSSASLASGTGPQAAIRRQLQATWTPSESLMQDLAGNAMALPVVLALMQCAFLALSWRDAGTEVSTAEDLQAAFGAIEALSEQKPEPRETRKALTPLEARLAKRAKNRD
ncbi:SSRP1 [Symbiodinium sp. CCMP2592]|nr:SSRP1 [Symbiodinium sp. CCMP2592]